MLLIIQRTTASSADWPSVANSTYFYDLTDKLVYYKDSSGTILSVFSSAGGLTYFTEARSTTAPNTTTNVDSLSAGTGLSTTDVDVALVPRGTGAFILAIPDNTATGGNKRGNYAVDLQLIRNTNTQVASGLYSLISGGVNNRSSDTGSSVLCGAGNTSSGTYGISGGISNISSGAYSLSLGRLNTASGDSSIALGQSVIAGGTYSFASGFTNTASGLSSIAMGSNNTASSTSSVAIGTSNSASGSYSFAIGYACTSSGDYGISLGTYANTFSQIGRIAFSSGRISTGGDIQKSFYILKGRSSSATPKTLTSDNGSITTASVIVLQNNNVFRFKGSIVGKQTGTTNIAVWDIDGVIVRGAGVATTVLTIANINLVTNAPGWGTPTLTADTTLGGLTVNVIGAAATNIQWIADVQTSEVIY